MSKQHTSNDENIKDLAKVLEQHIVKINNHLHAICHLLELDDTLNINYISEDVLELKKKLKDIKEKEKFEGIKFNQINLQTMHEDAISRMLAREEFEKRWPNLTEKEITDGEKRAIIDLIMKEESQKHQKETQDKIDRIKGMAGINTRDSSKKPSIEPQRETPKMSVFDKVNEAIEKGKAQEPPKTDWKRVDVSKSEKQKILNSIKSNPKSKIFSKDFKWDLNEFLSAFDFLESKSYDGPFIVSVVKDKEELKKYAEIKGMKENIENIYIGKYVLTSIYDITASTENKYIYIGFNYSQMEGALEFDTIGAIKRGVTKEQKSHAREFMDFHKIIYKNLK